MPGPVPSDVIASGSVGFIGLGNMGARMAANLIKAGYDVIGHNRSRGAVDRLVAHGGRAAESVADAARQAEVVITMLPDGPDVEDVMLGTAGILDSINKGSLVIDMSTIPPATARKLAVTAQARGVSFLDAPVSGGTRGADEGTLSVMVGGVAADFKRAERLLAALGDTIRHVGGPGAGQTVKAANQLVVAGVIEALAEAIVFLEASGADVDAALDAIGAGLAGSTILDRKGRSMAARDFTPGFRAALHHKDLGIVYEAARAAGVAIPLGALLAQLMGALTVQGHGDLDHTALLMIVDQLSSGPVQAQSSADQTQAGVC